MKGFWLPVLLEDVQHMTYTWYTAEEIEGERRNNRGWV